MSGRRFSASAALLAATATAALALGVGVGHWLWATDGAPAASAERTVLYWVAPMDRNYRRDKPGKSPMGMDLVPVYADEAAPEDDDVVTIDPTVMHNLGVRSALAERGVLPRRIDAVGYVEYDEDTVHHIHTRVEGWIESLGVQAAGDPVTQGQTLFEIYSPMLVNAQHEYLAATAHASSELRKASRERLLALGMAAEEIDRLAETRQPSQRVRVPAPADGVATHLGVREGIYVTPATHVLSVADLNHVWVLAEVFDRQAAWVAPGQRAEVRLEHLPGETWAGSVDYVYPELDSRTRTLKVRIGFDNAGRALRPNMFARVTLFSDDTGPVVHIPREALIRGGDGDRVVRDLGDGRFQGAARSRRRGSGRARGGARRLAGRRQRGDIRPVPHRFGVQRGRGAGAVPPAVAPTPSQLDEPGHSPPPTVSTNIIHTTERRHRAPCRQALRGAGREALDGGTGCSVGHRQPLPGVGRRRDCGGLGNPFDAHHAGGRAARSVGRAGDREDVLSEARRRAWWRIR